MTLSRVAIVLAATLLSGAPAFAQTLTGEQAEGQLFKGKSVEIKVFGHDFLTETDRTTLQQLAGAIQYYGAIAAAPDGGLMAEPTMVAANYHTVEAATAAAIAGCAAKGGKNCVIVAELRPKGWSARGLQLSLDATAGFKADYTKAKAPKALAISAGTGQWAISTGGDAAATAVSSCEKKAKATDCAVVVSD